MLDHPGLKVEVIVVAVGEKEVEEQIKQLEKSKTTLKAVRLEIRQQEAVQVLPPPGVQRRVRAEVQPGSKTVRPEGSSQGL